MSTTTPYYMVKGVTSSDQVWVRMPLDSERLPWATKSEGFTTGDDADEGYWSTVVPCSLARNCAPFTVEVFLHARNGVLDVSPAYVDLAPIGGELTATELLDVAGALQRAAALVTVANRQAWAARIRPTDD